MIEMEAEIKNLAIVWSIVIASLCYCRLQISPPENGGSSLSSPFSAYSPSSPSSPPSPHSSSPGSPISSSSSSPSIGAPSFPNPYPLSSPWPLFPSPSAPPPPPPHPQTKPPLSPNRDPHFCSARLATTSLQAPDPPFLVMITYCCLIFLMIEILVDSSSFLKEVLLGLRLERPSDEPYLSTSLREFWGRRWNLTVSSILRQTVYRPIRSAAAAVIGGDRAATVGVVAAFVVSGLIHELLFWYVNRVPPSWEMTMFFVFQGVGVAVESGMKWRVRWPAAVGFVVVTSFWLFFPPVMRNGADLRVIEEIGSVVERVKRVCMVAYNSSN